MATYMKFEDFIEQVFSGLHDFTLSGVIDIYLSNTTPDAAADVTKSDLAEISTGNGYTGPEDTQATMAQVTGTVTVTGTKVTFTATAGGIAQFRYIVLFNNTSPENLMAWWDYGVALDLAEGESLTVKFNNGDPTGTIFTAA